MTNNELQIAELQALCSRTLAILEEHNFFERTLTTDGYSYSNLLRDLKKAQDGDEFKTFKYMMERLSDIKI